MSTRLSIDVDDTGEWSAWFIPEASDEFPYEPVKIAEGATDEWVVRDTARGALATWARRVAEQVARDNTVSLGSNTYDDDGVWMDGPVKRNFAHFYYEIEG